jgi:olefin beta-lactone synthetase
VTLTSRARTRNGVADASMSESVRSASGLNVAAVLVRDALPVDIRHNSKIDRGALAQWASELLAGRGEPA